MEITWQDALKVLCEFYTQAEVGEKLGVSRVSISNWTRGFYEPQPRFRLLIVRLALGEFPEQFKQETEEVETGE